MIFIQMVYYGGDDDFGSWYGDGNGFGYCLLLPSLHASSVLTYYMQSITNNNPPVATRELSSSPCISRDLIPLLRVACIASIK